MGRIALAGVLAALLLGLPLADRAAASEKVRHSGRILEVAPDGGAIVLEEIVAWSGPGTGVVTRSIRLTPRTSITLVARTDEWGPDGAAMPGWSRRPADATGLRPGDFVTVTTDDDTRGVAVALQVVRPAAE
jgi:hypothetical protein